MMDTCQVFQPAIPLPDGTIGVGDRLALLWFYSGIAGGLPVEGVGIRERFISISKIRSGI